MADKRAAAEGPAQGLHVVTHAIDPVVAPGARVLILGTMPSPASRDAGFYYGHPRNRFWPVVARVFDEASVPLTTEGRRELILRHRLALWDVLARCEIRGASDASIADPVPNDLVGRVLSRAPIRAVFTTGATAHRLYHRLCEPATGIPAVCLPSTSPANAAWHLDALVEAYRPIRVATGL
ncbi:MAG: DNA-deoxyinosine glycosylase [Coriobacteriia bacterium]|nr:DNA-deoxyinosine glycosylase [Coriobacteriia bacterium]MBS5479130.1 DNA-deoxyinosine glycosylase [Coriobacteriia bacterium]